jgi:hypothetical protein
MLCWGIPWGNPCTKPWRTLLYHGGELWSYLRYITKGLQLFWGGQSARVATYAALFWFRGFSRWLPAWDL